MPACWAPGAPPIASATSRPERSDPAAPQPASAIAAAKNSGNRRIDGES
jgi:hypothetical protein